MKKGESNMHFGSFLKHQKSSDFCGLKISKEIFKKKGFSYSKISQVSFEYLIIMGFVTFVIIGILGIAMIYSNVINDRIKVVQMNNCADKIISASESIFYSGYPSRATITCYFPNNVKEIEILENTLFVTVETSSGNSKMAFSSNVPISGNLNPSQGLKKIKIEAGENQTIISPY